jgi:hypothetical protein
MGLTADELKELNRKVARQFCTNLKEHLKELPRISDKFFTPGHPENQCIDTTLSPYEMEEYKKDFCSLRPANPMCLTSPSVGSSEDETFNQRSTILLFSVIGCFSCIMTIVLLFFMMKRRQT